MLSHVFKKIKTHFCFTVNAEITQIKHKDLFLEEEREITVSAAVTTLLFTFMINLSVIFLPAGSELSVVASRGLLLAEWEPTKQSCVTEKNT